ncbi:MAG: cold shock domain-containing protein [Pirellulales bacterium]|nr:cold shock domain-containing protein [Pirellulales bacterium]
MRLGNLDRGFGFIEKDRADDLFFHHSALQGATIDELREGQVVEYEQEIGFTRLRAEPTTCTAPDPAVMLVFENRNSLHRPGR